MQLSQRDRRTLPILAETSAARNDDAWSPARKLVVILAGSMLAWAFWGGIAYLIFSQIL